MNFYRRFIGDIQRKTGHLSCTEMGVYDRLLDHYYALEAPLPADVDACCRIARAMTKDERKAVQTVLSEFFALTEKGYVQGRADQEIAEQQPKIAAARANGNKGGRPKKEPDKEPDKKPSGFFPDNPTDNPNDTQDETQAEPNSKTSQSQSKYIGIPPVLAKEKRSVCGDLHTQNFEEFRTAMRESRPELDFEITFANFREYYPADKQTLAKWRQWVQNEKVGGGAGKGHSEPGGADPHDLALQDPDSRASIEAEGERKGIGRWNGCEQWSVYKARVIGPTPQQRQRFEQVKAEALGKKTAQKTANPVVLGMAA